MSGFTTHQPRSTESIGDPSVGSSSDPRHFHRFASASERVDQSRSHSPGSRAIRPGRAARILRRTRDLATFLVSVFHARPPAIRFFSFSSRQVRGRSPNSSQVRANVLKPDQLLNCVTSSLHTLSRQTFRTSATVASKWTVKDTKLFVAFSMIER